MTSRPNSWRSGSLRTTHRVTSAHPCPVCGKRDWCLVSDSGAYAVCMRVASGQPARGGMGGWVHHLGCGGYAAPVERISEADNRPRRAAPDLLDAVYRDLLRLLDLSWDHRHQLRQRGLTDDEIRHHWYKTLPLEDRAALCRELLDDHELAGIAGFFIAEDDGTWWTFAGSPGLVIPVKDTEGRVVALRLRPDSPDQPKYVWFSSAGRRSGVGSGALCHIARRLRSVTDSRIWLTEGELKADIASERLGAVVVSIPGVAAWRKALAVLRRLVEPGGAVVVAFDADARTNAAVAEHEADLILALDKAGYQVHRAVWRGAHKGVDDALVAGADVGIERVNAVRRLRPHRRRRRGPRRTVRVGEPR